jgi:hypothetical protein
MSDKNQRYESQFGNLVANKDFDGADALVRAAFADPDCDEHLLGWLVGSTYDLRIDKSIDLLHEFTKRFPRSVHPILVFTSDLYARSGNFDMATLESRIYLRTIKDLGILDDLASKNIIRAGVSQAFLLATAAYTELGARTFSIGVLHMALKYDLTSDMADAIRSEIGRLTEELKDSSNLERDNKWNTFHATGGHVQELFDSCQESGYPVMAKFVSAIESQFRYSRDFKFDSESIFKILVSNEGAIGMA